MAKANLMCDYYDERATREGHRRAMDRVNQNWLFRVTDEADKEARRASKKHVRCPKCGRRLKPRISFCHDGCCVYLSIPPHKKKGWWKKRKIGKKENRRSKSG